MNRQERKLVVGDVVMIYRNPVTQKGPEGQAILVKEQQFHCGKGFSMWLVAFLDEPDQAYLRTVKGESV